MAAGDARAAVIDPATPAVVWLPDRQYRLTYSNARGLWLLLAEDDLQWVAFAQALAAPTANADTDMAATSDGTPLLYRRHRYLLRHEDLGHGRPACGMTIAAIGRR